MSDEYDYFMLYEVDDSGNSVRLNVAEEEFREDNGRKFLHPEQVIIIVKEGIRRIYIWKGAKSSVRKRFISSRVASQLQEELVRQAAFHRCKIVSVDQGDEVVEFLRAFNFKSMEVTEKLADMRYIRNVDREKMIDAGIFPDHGPKFVKVETKPKEPVSVSSGSDTPKTKSTAPIREESYQPAYQTAPVRSYTPPRSSLGSVEENKIKEKILKMQVPENYKRQNLILGHTLYGAVTKKVNVLGEVLEETGWEVVKKVPKGMIEISTGHMLRAYFNDESGIVEAVEILELKGEAKEKPTVKPIKKKPVAEKVPAKKKPTAKKAPAKKKAPTKKPVEKKLSAEVNYASWTVKELRNYCAEHKIKLPANARKTDLIKLVKESLKSSKQTESKSPKRRELRKIPSKED